MLVCLPGGGGKNGFNDDSTDSVDITGGRGCLDAEFVLLGGSGNCGCNRLGGDR